MRTVIGKVSGKPIDLYTDDEVFADLRRQPGYEKELAKNLAELEAEQAFWAKAKRELRKIGITGKLAEEILDRLWELGYYEHQTGKSVAEPAPAE